MAKAIDIKDNALNLGGMAAGAVGSSFISTRLGGPNGKTIAGIIPLEAAIAGACYLALQTDYFEEHEELLASVGVGALAAAGYRLVKTGLGGPAPGVGAEWYDPNLLAAGHPAAMALPPGAMQPGHWYEAPPPAVAGSYDYDSYDDFIDVHGETGASQDEGDDALAEAEEALDALAAS